MLIRELAGDNLQAARLAALAEFLLGRAEDSAASKTIDTKAFLKLAQGLQISVTDQQLRDLIRQPPLNSVIKDIQGDVDTGVIVLGDQTDVDVLDKMTPDQARQNVSNMAKRAVDIK